MPAHARAGRDRDRSRLHVADDDAPFLYIDPLGGFDVALKLAADHDDAGQDLAGKMGPRLDAEIAVDTNIPLEAARHTYISRPLDLALDRQIRGNDRFAPLR